MSIYAKLEGVSQCMKAFDKAPENLLKLVKKASQSASRKANKHMQNALDPRWRGLCTYKVTNKKGNIVSTIGLFDKGDATGHQPKEGADPVMDWFKAYWNNYGTLGGRDPNHKFREPVKKRQTSTNKSGLAHKNFFENAMAGCDEVYEKEFLSFIEKNKDKI